MLKPADHSIPLREWIESDAKRHVCRPLKKDGTKSRLNPIEVKRNAIIRKTTVAYGLAELLKHAKDRMSLSLSPGDCVIDNFMVRTRSPPASSSFCSSRLPPGSCNDIIGFEMKSPSISIKIEQRFLECEGDVDMIADEVDGNDGNMRGRFFEVTLDPQQQSGHDTLMGNSEINDGVNDMQLCHFLGVVLYELYSHLSPFPSETEALRDINLEEAQNDNGGGEAGGEQLEIFAQEPARKKSTSQFLQRSTTVRKEEIFKALQDAPFIPMHELGFPSSICDLVQDLIDCRNHSQNRPKDAYSSLEECCTDLQLLLHQPNRFLFGIHDSSNKPATVTLEFSQDKLFGRETEISVLADAFGRVLSGTNEAVCIGAFEGNGKTRLVQEVIPQVESAGGKVVSHSFDVSLGEWPLWKTDIFNNLCLTIRDSCSAQELTDISIKLMSSLTLEASIALRALPNITALCPQFATAIDSNRDSNLDPPNLKEVCVIVKSFLRAVTSTHRPLMIFLDDLHAADRDSLQLMHSILTDPTATIFFVGCYRDNEINSDSEISKFLQRLQTSGVSLVRMGLQGLELQDLNSMISTSLCSFPRVSLSLSKITHQKTLGSPHFAIKFLKAQFEKKSLQYSLRKRRWTWTEEKIASEGVTNNTLLILVMKMKTISPSVREAIKTASCFGMQVSEDVVNLLSSTPQHASFREDMDEAIREGFVEKVGTFLRFTHDKIFEESYNLISKKEKHDFHFNLGSLMYCSTKGKDLGDIVFKIADQMNKGLRSSLLRHHSMETAILDLNSEAGILSFERSDFPSAQSYLNVALSYLPADCWQQQYTRCHQIHMLGAKANYSCGHLHFATTVLDKLLANSRDIYDKLDAYSLYTTILNVSNELGKTFGTCKDILTTLGENIPDNCNASDTVEMVQKTYDSIKNITDQDFSIWDSSGEMDRKDFFVLKFYHQLAQTAFHFKTELIPFISCRLCELSMNKKVSEYTTIGFVQFATLCISNVVVGDRAVSIELGKKAMRALQQQSGEIADKSARAYLNVIYYGFFAPNAEPLQSNADMLKSGFEMGISIGDTSCAFWSALHEIRLSLTAGKKLPSLLEECNQYVNLAENYKLSQWENFLLMYRETIRVIMNKGDLDEKVTARAERKIIPEDSLHFHRTIQSFWLGYPERCHHYAERVLQDNHGRHYRTIILFYQGVSAVHLLRRAKGGKHKGGAFKTTVQSAMEALKISAEQCKWNYKNKFLLLKAESFSLEGKNDEAKSAYAAAISAARASRFGHEQALASELAGFHYKNIGNAEKAHDFFNHAKTEYAKWGSTMKSSQMETQMNECAHAVIAIDSCKT